MEDEDVAHLAGVFDAAGGVSARVRQADTAVGYRLEPTVRLRRPASERALLGKLAAYCRERDVRHECTERGESDAAAEAWTLEVTEPGSVRRFLEPMLPYLVEKRTPATVMLDKIVPGLGDGSEPTKREFYRLVGYADKLRAAGTASVGEGDDGGDGDGDGDDGERTRYTQEFFEELWYDELDR